MTLHVVLQSQHKFCSKRNLYIYSWKENKNQGYFQRCVRVPTRRLYVFSLSHLDPGSQGSDSASVLFCSGLTSSLGRRVADGARWGCNNTTRISSSRDVPVNTTHPECATAFFQRVPTFAISVWQLKGLRDTQRRGVWGCEGCSLIPHFSFPFSY